jgi:NTE family protein
MSVSDQLAGAGANGNTRPAGEKVINLALQGGGSHGAFTWGVLDRLLEEPRLKFDGVTATSAGAFNAVALADGLAAGGREGARKTLRNYWKKVADISARGIFAPSPWDKTDPDHGLKHSPGYLFMESLTYFASPYQINPFNFNPLKDLLAETIDFKRVREQKLVKLFISATNVETAKVKVFHGYELDVDHVLASTCLPLMMQAVPIGDACYWDGSFTGNPAIFPLVYECDTPDIMMVHITPAERPGVPKTSPSIMNRMQEISFNVSLIREMRTIAYVTKLVETNNLPDVARRYMHLIEAEDLIRELAWSSRLNGDWDFLKQLHDSGRARADEWLAANFDSIGVKSTLDLQAKYF